MPVEGRRNQDAVGETARPQTECHARVGRSQSQRSQNAFFFVNSIKLTGKKQQQQKTGAIGRRQYQGDCQRDGEKTQNKGRLLIFNAVSNDC